MVAIALSAMLCLASWSPIQARAPDSSGGYRRPAPSYQAPVRRPPVSGSYGYSRPSVSGPAFSGSSPGDMAVSRRAAQDALNSLRARQRAEAEAARRPSPWAGGAAPAPVPQRRPPPGGWQAPTYAAPGFSAPGFWSTAAAWALLGALTAPNRDSYFRQYQDDPGYRQWRQEAERRAAQDPEVAANLRNLDASLAQPAPAPPAETGGGYGVVLLVVLVGGALFGLLWLRRRRAGATAAAPPEAAARYRVGMVLPADPSAFLLAGGLKVRPPEGGGMLSVEAVGTLRGGPAVLYRLYVAGGFFQLHLGASGAPDECRWFSQVDEVAPASAEEWRFWIDPGGGAIGWPSFQTKDGKLYARVWNAGTVAVPPITFEERIQRLGEQVRREHQAMLYGAPTGAAPPAPGTEYILVDAVEAQNGASVLIYAGIDVNPAALELPAVPLDAQRSAA